MCCDRCDSVPSAKLQLPVPVLCCLAVDFSLQNPNRIERKNGTRCAAKLHNRTAWRNTSRSKINLWFVPVVSLFCSAQTTARLQAPGRGSWGCWAHLLLVVLQFAVMGAVCGSGDLRFARTKARPDQHEKVNSGRLQPLFNGLFGFPCLATLASFALLLCCQLQSAIICLLAAKPCVGIRIDLYHGKCGKHYLSQLSR